MVYYEEFHKYFSNLPEVIEYCDQGNYVFETFETDSGEEMFVHAYTRDAYNQWIEQQ